MKFLLLCTLILGLAFFMASALPQANEYDAPMVDLEHDHHQVVRSAPVHLDDEKNPHKHDEVACCG
ncbi:uncharacterized protein LOC108035242 [Drosophila biarmipes]|uniref:uncharacterized protein LOC108035242 n=1 Tax=Drosophila biarmipes TaxID=125945 RepID=UPI0007E7B09C|nr:uncharacterized protein LOC108035242 [Drosophila biarmipes]